jgi:hypothetical protein
VCRQRGGREERIDAHDLDEQGGNDRRAVPQDRRQIRKALTLLAELKENDFSLYSLNM